MLISDDADYDHQHDRRDFCASIDGSVGKPKSIDTAKYQKHGPNDQLPVKLWQ